MTCWSRAPPCQRDAILTTEVPQLSLVPGAARSRRRRTRTGRQAEEREYRLREALAPVAERFDFILIDCPPSLNLLTVNALSAAAAVLVPLQCEYYALEGLSQLMKTIDVGKTELESRTRNTGRRFDHVRPPQQFMRHGRRRRAPAFRRQGLRHRDPAQHPPFGSTLSWQASAALRSALRRLAGLYPSRRRDAAPRAAGRACQRASAHERRQKARPGTGPVRTAGRGGGTGPRATRGQRQLADRPARAEPACSRAGISTATSWRRWRNRSARTACCSRSWCAGIPSKPDMHEIVAGERRWRAAQLAGLHEVPVMMRELSDREVLELALVENLQRHDLSALEEAEGYRRLIEEFGRCQEDLGRRVGKSRAHIANTLRLLKLPEEREGAADRRASITAGHARALLAARDPVALAAEDRCRGALGASDRGPCRAQRTGAGTAPARRAGKGRRYPRSRARSRQAPGPPSRDRSWQGRRQPDRSAIVVAGTARRPDSPAQSRRASCLGAFGSSEAWPSISRLIRRIIAFRRARIDRRGDRRQIAMGVQDPDPSADRSARIGRGSCRGSRKSAMRRPLAAMRAAERGLVHLIAPPDAHGRTDGANSPERPGSPCSGAPPAGPPFHSGTAGETSGSSIVEARAEPLPDGRAAERSPRRCRTGRARRTAHRPASAAAYRHR